MVARWRRRERLFPRRRTLWQDRSSRARSESTEQTSSAVLGSVMKRTLKTLRLTGGSDVACRQMSMPAPLLRKSESVFWFLSKFLDALDDDPVIFDRIQAGRTWIAAEQNRQQGHGAASRRKGGLIYAAEGNSP
ncbi:hypothetical protein Ae201684P_016817 [Aphanomyces euteiches]|uniref:Uncharacterized protein n=1 Tax=Aphanomyces euteiches TaxID=100861 RepID=A0A6G0XJ33_9STRA|nr:hypothetical protein Ae201684_004297 [Aphanomyces euteiches]KAH9094205.1 hypothetical protein Ae201684P_016817 [Aphanomyces euteiches]